MQIRRVTKVVKGGKQLSFRAVVVVGNEKGTVGVGTASAKEVIMAVQVPFQRRAVFSILVAARSARTNSIESTPPVLHNARAGNAT